MKKVNRTKERLAMHVHELIHKPTPKGIDNKKPIYLPEGFTGKDLSRFKKMFPEHK